MRKIKKEEGRRLGAEGSSGGEFGKRGTQSKDSDKPTQTQKEAKRAFKLLTLRSSAETTLLLIESMAGSPAHSGPGTELCPSM